jgi:predicted nucleic acid-binding protein
VAIVTDASIILASFLEDEWHDAAPALADLDRNEWVVPTLWWFELRNALIVNERRRRTSPELSAGFLRHLSGMPTTVDTVPDSDLVMQLARRHRLTVYDATYLELAIRLGLPLATLDVALARAARAEGVPLVGEPQR